MVTCQEENKSERDDDEFKLKTQHGNNFTSHRLDELLFFFYLNNAFDKIIRCVWCKSEGSNLGDTNDFK